MPTDLPDSVLSDEDDGGAMISAGAASPATLSGPTAGALPGDGDGDGAGAAAAGSSARSVTLAGPHSGPLPAPDAHNDAGHAGGEVVGFTSADEPLPPGADTAPWALPPTAAPAPPPAASAAHAVLPDVLVIGGEAAPGLPAAPPPYTPRPRPPIRPERTPEGHYRTDGILIERVAGRSCFVTIHPPQAASQRVYVDRHALERLLAIASALNWEQGKLWRALADIPLERPLPSRRLEEELKALLTTFAADLRD